MKISSILYAFLEIINDFNKTKIYLVIPAKAGIHNVIFIRHSSAGRQAFAGMTVTRKMYRLFFLIKYLLLKNR